LLGRFANPTCATPRRLLAEDVANDIAEGAEGVEIELRERVALGVVLAHVEARSDVLGATVAGDPEVDMVVGLLERDVEVASLGVNHGASDDHAVDSHGIRAGGHESSKVGSYLLACAIRVRMTRTLLHILSKKSM